VQGLIRIEAATGEEIASTLSNEQGEFRFRLPASAEYIVTGWADGYEEANQKIDLRKKNGTVTNVTLSLKKSREVGAARPAESQPRRPQAAPSQGAASTPRRSDAGVQRENGLVVDGFAVGSSEVPQGAIAKLREFLTNIRTLRAGEVIGLEVVGHTDNVGDGGGNQGLSLERAESIKRWLVENGVEAESILTLGRGEAVPVVSNGDDAARARNRRVEIRILAIKNDQTNPR
jgi:outer membrane protein OmpA-like peptidoglycan-associated protein